MRKRLSRKWRGPIRTVFQMSISFVEHSFTKVFENIYEISKFLNTADAESLDDDLIKTVFTAADYVEKLVAGLKTRGMYEIFQQRLSEFLAWRGAELFLSSYNPELLCDDVLGKVLSLEPGLETASGAVSVYLGLVPRGRLEAVVVRLAELRAISERLSRLAPPASIAASHLARAWLRSDPAAFLPAALTDPAAGPLLLALLDLPDLPALHLLLLDLVAARPCLPAWLHVLRAEELLHVLREHPPLMDAVLITLESMEKLFRFDMENKIWLSSDPDVIEYPMYFSLVEKLFTAGVSHFPLKKFISVRKRKGPSQFWEHVSEGLTSL